MEQKQQKKSKWWVAIIILLLIIIGVLLWLLLRPQPEPARIPTGNVDVFDIDISCICTGEDGEECDDDEDEREATPGNGGHKGYHGSTINDRDDTTVDDDGIVYVDDKNGWYVYQQNLKIFENAAFEYIGKIAPGASNSYDFKVHNETKNAIRYRIQFEEESEYPINMLYRLRQGDSYVIGNANKWVSGSELIMQSQKILSSNGTDNYTLDWKWPYEGGKDAADTEAGEKMTSEYSLGIKINFEEV